MEYKSRLARCGVFDPSKTHICDWGGITVQTFLLLDSLLPDKEWRSLCPGALADLSDEQAALIETNPRLCYEVFH